MQSKSIDWFLNDRDLRHETVNASRYAKAYLELCKISQSRYLFSQKILFYLYYFFAALKICFVHYFYSEI